MLPHHNHPVAIWQRGIENNTEGFAQNIQSHNCNEKICAIKSMAPLQHITIQQSLTVLYNTILLSLHLHAW